MVQNNANIGLSKANLQCIHKLIYMRNERRNTQWILALYVCVWVGAWGWSVLGEGESLIKENFDQKLLESIARMYKSLESGNGIKISDEKQRSAKPKYLKNKT